MASGGSLVSLHGNLRYLRARGLVAGKAATDDKVMCEIASPTNIAFAFRIVISSLQTL